MFAKVFSGCNLVDRYVLIFIVDSLSNAIATFHDMINKTGFFLKKKRIVCLEVFGTGSFGATLHAIVSTIGYIYNLHTT